jgi:SAM-dependent methyltransferase
MHFEAMDWVAKWATSDEPLTVADVGGRDINGNPRHLFHPDSVWEVVDLHPGGGVTWVGDWLDYHEPGEFDVVLYLEVAEHAAQWPEHVTHAAEVLAPGGLFVFTAAGPNRAAHSHIDGGVLRPGEHYANIDPERLDAHLDATFNHHIVDVTPDGADVRAAAWR